METETLKSTHAEAIPRALEVLQRDGLVAYPTDTVYGVAASAFSPAGIERLFLAKGRESIKAIAVLLGDSSQLPRVTTAFGEYARRLAERFWPGPLTLIVTRHPDLPEVLSPLPTIGLRIPDHRFARALLRRAGPLATTSANLSGGENPHTAQDVLRQLGGRIDLVLDGGATPGGVPSTVIDCTGPEPVVLRAGPISLEAIQAALG
ncbi:MAG: L-threonylcarbamoyladenylate synthase [Chloroflexi bacterium]|nr:L-threonylcarbamoyladenylate synthase [Chloroflexota bacterium]